MFKRTNQRILEANAFSELEYISYHQEMDTVNLCTMMSMFAKKFRREFSQSTFEFKEWFLFEEYIYFMDGRRLANYMWACAKLSLEPPGAVLERAKAVVKDMNSQNVCNYVWACATLELQPPEVVLERAKAVAKDMDAERVCNYVWACGRLGLKPPEAVLERAKAVAADMNTQGVCDYVWACTRLGLKPPEAMLELKEPQVLS